MSEALSAAAWAELCWLHMAKISGMKPSLKLPLNRIFYFGAEIVSCYWLALKINRTVAGLISPAFQHNPGLY